MQSTSRRKLWLQRLAPIAVLLLIAIGFIALARIGPGFFYRTDRVVADERVAAAKQFVRRSTGLYNDMENESAWSGTFEDEQINAWLAGDFAAKHGNILPAGVTDPRLDFDRGRIALAFRAKWGVLTTVVSVSGRVWMPEPNLIAVEFEQIHAGQIPLPAGAVMDKLSSAAKSAGGELTWKQHHGNPVALLVISRLTDRTGISIERVEPHDGVLYIAGRSEKNTTKRHNSVRSDSTESADEVSMKDQSPDSSPMR